MVVGSVRYVKEKEV